MSISKRVLAILYYNGIMSQEFLKGTERERLSKLIFVSAKELIRWASSRGGDYYYESGCVVSTEQKRIFIKYEYFPSIAKASVNCSVRPDPSGLEIDEEIITIPVHEISVHNSHLESDVLRAKEWQMVYNFEREYFNKLTGRKLTESELPENVLTYTFYDERLTSETQYSHMLARLLEKGTLATLTMFDMDKWFDRKRLFPVRPISRTGF